MSHLSDKELDRLGREAAEQNDIEQNTSGWDKLHLRLDKEMPIHQRKQRRSLLLLLSLIVLLTGSGLVYRYVNGPELPVANKSGGDVHQDEPFAKREKLNNTTVPSIASVKPVAVDKNLPANNSKNADVTVKNPTSKEQASSNDITNSEKVKETTGGTGNNSVIKNNSHPVLSARKNQSVPRRKEIVSVRLASEEKKKASVNTTMDEVTVNRRVGMETVNAPLEITSPLHVTVADVSVFTAIKKPAIDRSVAVMDHAIKQSLENTTTNKKGQQPNVKKFPFSIAVVGGTDWSTVRFTHNDKPGYNAGILFYWHFAKKLSLTTGALYTKKNYSAYGKDYHPPKGYWTNYITLDKVNGSCWMIDIPLNLRYDFAGGKKFNFFGSAGVSTYLMNKESYTYHYMYNGNYTNRKWLNDENSRYVFSVINIAAGYEKSVGKKVSVQVEPYLKMPISGIGFGKMQMNSYGLNFALRFRPEYKKQNTTIPVINP